MTISIDPISNASLLRYALEVIPHPLQAGRNASLVLAVSNAGGDSITCSSIVLTVPDGTNATDLIDAGSLITTRPAFGWFADVSGGTITFTAPEGGAAVAGAGLVFTIAIKVNEQAGTATIGLQETARDEDDPLQARTTSFTIDKFPADFSLSDLASVPPDLAIVPHGGRATLMWAATGADVQCVLSYVPDDSEELVSQDVPMIGPLESKPLTRNDSVTFTLAARQEVPGQDNPLVLERQLTMAVKTLSLTFEVQPPAVGPNGLVRLHWSASNAERCTLEDGVVLPPSGSMLVLLENSRRFVLTAHGEGETSLQVEHDVAVNPAIQANQSPVTIVGFSGPQGPPGEVVDEDRSRRRPTPGGAGGRGGDAELGRLAPLDETVNPARVIPVTLTGGRGGPGGPGGYVTSMEDPNPLFAQPDGPGGPGGDAVLSGTFDGAGEPAQYIVRLVPGSGGPGSSPGPSGSVRTNICLRESAEP